MLDSLLPFFESYPLIFLAIIPFLGQCGIPSGSIFLLLFAGSLILTRSEMIFFFVVGLSSAVAGDMLSYWIGRNISSWQGTAPYLQIQKVQSLMDSSRLLFQRYGQWGIFLTRFLIVTPAPYLNYFVGFQKYSFYSYARLVIAGEILYVGELLFLGYLFADTFEYLVDIITDIGLVGVLMVFLILFLISLMRQKQERGVETQEINQKG